jgi:hypothetical protein
MKLLSALDLRKLRLEKIGIQQEYFEPKSPFKSNDLKGLVNFCRDGWTNFQPVDT